MQNLIGSLNQQIAVLSAQLAACQPSVKQARDLDNVMDFFDELVRDVNKMANDVQYFYDDTGRWQDLKANYMNQRVQTLRALWGGLRAKVIVA
jgi:hypothetical protein